MGRSDSEYQTFKQLSTTPYVDSLRVPILIKDKLQRINS
ncbi:hypothetical protein FM106_04115 [Brachybacterium faecium]|nr:hypothetical protein FM106_04115 [Brachybacterium faecium]